MNVQKEQIDEILAKWLTNTATEDELATLQKWAGQSDDNLELIENLQKTWHEDTAEPILVNVDAKANEIWASAMNELPKQTRSGNLWIKYAAAILILSCSFFWLLSRDDFEQKEQENISSVAPTYILRENAAGQKTKVYLPDGSIAFVNSSSSIKYINGFAGDERRVYLEGEAFFEVAKDKSKPFVVESATIETVALGTAFNVKAFDDAKEVRVSLIEGEVRINQAETTDEATILSPGFELVVNSNTQEVLQQPFEVEDVIGWKEGKLVFNHASLEEVSLSLERWYAVDITLKGRVPANWKISTVYENQSLQNVLIDLQYSKNFAYEINESNVTITF